MNICFISDTHSKHDQLKKDLTMPADFIVSSGDISTRGYGWEIRSFLEWFSQLSQFRYKIFIAGNHDFGFQDHPTEFAEMLLEYPNVIYLQDSGVEIEGVKFWGSPATPYFFNWAFNYLRGDDINRIWSKMPDEIDVLITHGPPYKHGDLVPPNRYNEDLNVGCKDLMMHVEQIKPKVHVFGHIHCGYGITTNGDTTFINASVLNEQYNYNNKPIYFEI